MGFLPSSFSLCVTFIEYDRTPSLFFFFVWTSRSALVGRIFFFFFFGMVSVAVTPLHPIQLVPPRRPTDTLFTSPARLTAR